jgi:hypothetical protein
MKKKGATLDGGGFIRAMAGISLEAPMWHWFLILPTDD